MRPYLRILASGLSVGLAGVLFGVVGPMLILPGNGDAPLYGLLTLGPLGLLLGLFIGARMERGRDPGQDR